MLRGACGVEMASLEVGRKLKILRQIKTSSAASSAER
jgi:hypothetical protein